MEKKKVIKEKINVDFIWWYSPSPMLKMDNHMQQIKWKSFVRIDNLKWLVIKSLSAIILHSLQQTHA